MSSLSGKQGPRYRHVAGEIESYETIGVEKLTPIIGAKYPASTSASSSRTIRTPTARWTKSTARSPKTS